MQGCHVGKEWTDRAWREYAHGRSSCRAHTRQAGENMGLPGHHKSAQECGWPAWPGGAEKTKASTTQIWAPGSPSPCPRGPTLLHYAGGETEAQRGATWLRSVWP